ncbi:hypothetical protein V496_03525 [Pseudogymnoascus sp. VKM F-4515 (FW-2607)]|nr:hypothetical protein V496_03525 [Pseudogymnoascus sp. VKM F-4515 (FW-2607)]
MRRRKPNAAVNKVVVAVSWFMAHLLLAATDLDGMAHHDEPSENEPLLPGTRQRRNSVSVLPTLHNPRLIIALLTGVMFLVNFGAFMMTMPQFRIFEDIICHHYYDNLSGPSHLSLDTPIDESHCKVDPVQAELATVVAGLFVASSVPSLLLSMPYGILADRIGRKPVFILSVIGIELTELLNLVICWWWRVFPLRFVWAMPFTQIIGGGATVTSAMLYATVADVAPAESRSQTFLVIMSGSLAAQILGPIVASKLMAWSPWPPMLLGLFMIVVGGVCFLFVPESLHARPSKPLTMSAPVSPCTISPPRQPDGLITVFKKHIRTTIDSASMLNSTPAVLLVSTFFLVFLAMQIVQLALRDISARFHWSLAQSGYLMSVRAVIDMAVVLAIIPGASHLLTRPRGPALSTRAKDYLLALISAYAMVIGRKRVHRVVSSVTHGASSEGSGREPVCCGWGRGDFGEYYGWPGAGEAVWDWIEMGGAVERRAVLGGGGGGDVLHWCSTGGEESGGEEGEGRLSRSFFSRSQHGKERTITKQASVAIFSYLPGYRYGRNNYQAKPSRSFFRAFTILVTERTITKQSSSRNFLGVSKPYIMLIIYLGGLAADAGIAVDILGRPWLRYLQNYFSIEAAQLRRQQWFLLFLRVPYSLPPQCART